MKAKGTRLVYIVVGLLCLAGGTFLSYLEIKQHSGSGAYRKWHLYPFGILLAGVVCVLVGFGKEDPTKTK